MIDVGRARRNPVLVDAAAERPDVPNPYLAMGADAVAYSGGKCLRGPQASGLVLGRRDLLWTAWLHASPHHGLARPMKAGKEEIMGLLAAVEAWVQGRDHAAEWRAWEGYLACIARAGEALPTVRTEVVPPGVANVAPNLCIRWDAATLGITPEEAYRALESGEPPIALHVRADGLQVNPYMMESGEDAIVAERLYAVLATGHGAGGPAAPPAGDLTGDWAVSVTYVRGHACQALTLIQEGAALHGTLRTRYQSAPVTGSICGRDVLLHAALGYQSLRTPYSYHGILGDDGALHGELDCGEFGRACWEAQREG